MSLAGALLLLSLRRPCRRMAAALGAFAFLIGALTLFEHLTRIDLGIDTIIIFRHWGQSAATSPSRMGPPASTCYTLLGSGVFFAAIGRTTRAFRFAAGAAIAVCVVALLSLVGNLFGAALLYAVPRLTAIALPTSVILITLGIGLITLAPAVEPLRTLIAHTSAAAIVRRVYPFLVMFALTLGYFRVKGEQAGLFDSAFGTALRTVIEIVLFGALLWWSARSTGAHEQELSRRKDELLRQSSALAAIVESSDDAIIGEDLDGVITSWNRGAEALFGYSPAEAIGRHITFLAPLDRRDEADQVLARLRAGEKIRHFETRRLAKDGSARDVSLSISPILDASGRIVGASKVARDLSERERAAIELSDARNRARLATEATGVGIWEWNIKTGQLRWDAEMFRIYGRMPSQDGEVTYPDWAAAVLPEDLAHQETLIRETIRTLGSCRREFRIRRASDGQVRHIHSVETVRCNQQGDVEWMVGTNLDITQRRLAEIALAEYQQLLEQKVRERTADLERAQAGLRRAERLSAMGAMAAGIGHDLSNIMVPIRWRIESLQRQQLSASAAEDVAEIRESLTYLARMAGGLRQMAANPDTPPPLEGTNIPQWWSEVHAMIRSVVPRHVTLVADIPSVDKDLSSPEPLPNVAIHRVALTQAVFNLVQNAGEALAKHPAGRIVISAATCGHNGSPAVALTIIDDGPGMSEQVAARCFEPYFSTKQKAVTTGMGLSLVRSFVESVGGSVDLQTAPGRGTSFSLRLPAAASAPSLPAPSGAHRPQS